MKVLAVAPCFDEASEYSFKWYERLREAVKGKIELDELLKESATRENFERALNIFKPEVIVYYNHGSEDCLCAQGGRECVLDSKNLWKASRKVIYSMACLSAKKLGAEAYMSYGCIYVGYVGEFAFTAKDEQYFCGAANSGFIAYANGEGDWGKIKAIMVEAFNRAIDVVDDVWSKMLLRWDRDALRVYAPNADQPKAECPLRRLAVRLLGSIGWKISRMHAVGWIFFLVGYGITMHAIASELYYKGGYAEILKPQGEWIGLSLILLGFILLVRDYIVCIRKV